MIYKTYTLSARHTSKSDENYGPMSDEFFALKLADTSEGGVQYGVWWKPSEDEAVINRRIRDMIENVVTEFKGEDNG